MPSDQSQASSSEPKDVIIVGAGPVGLGLAIELGQRGVSSTVIERNTRISPIPKGQNLTQRTAEHFYFWGAEKELRAARPFPASFGMGGLTTYGELFSPYSYNWLARELVRPFYFTENERLPQYATEGVLRDRVAKLPNVEVLYGWKAGLTGQDAAGAYAEAAEVDGAGRRTLRGRYLVGCDGAWSTVREGAGLTQTLTDHDRVMVLLVFRSEGLDRLMNERYPGKCFFNVLHPDDKGYWQFFGRVDPDKNFFFHAPVPADTTRDNFDFAALLQRAAGAEFDVDLQHVGFWNLRFALADSYRRDRVFIAGDAAHSHPPYGGYGVNTGFEDARNLGWKLAATLQGWGGPGLLDSYSSERQPVFRSTIDNFIEWSILRDRDFLAGFDPKTDRAGFEREWSKRSTGAEAEVGAFEPNYEGSPIVWGPPGNGPGAVGAHAMKARPGHHLSPHALSSGSNVYELLGEGFTLLSFGGDPATVKAFQAAAARSEIPLAVVEDDSIAARQAYEAALVLVRPDQFIAWTSNEGGTPSSILLRSAGFEG